MSEKLSRLNEKLAIRDNKLNLLLEITTAINNNSPTDKLLDIFSYILKEQLGVTKAMMFNFDKEWKCVMKYGFKGSYKDINPAKDFSGVKQMTLIESSSKKSVSSFDMVIPVFHKNQPLAYLLIGDLSEEDKKVSPGVKHFNFIQTLANIITVAIENKRLAKEFVRQERVKKELELAAEMQSLLLPDNLPQNKSIEIAAKYVAHLSVGGDYYDYIPIDEDEFVFCVADVSGKGISAALIMANFQANLRALIKYTNFGLSKVVEELNATLLKNSKGERFITLFLGRYNIISRKLKYINAGHNPPVFCDNKSFKFLFEGCTGIGMVDKIPHIEEGSVFVNSGSVLVCYTDGLIEIEDDNNVQFSLEKLTETIQKNLHQPKISDINDIIFEIVEKHKGNKPFADDTALFSIRFS